jgi:hypothetical protein
MIMNILKTHPVLLIGFMIFLNVSCEQMIRWNLKPSEQIYLVVDGIITNEMKQQSIDLSFSFNDQNDSIKYPVDAQINIYDGTDTFHFIPNPEIPGNYISETAFTGVINKNYRLEIFHQNKTYYAIANMYPVATSVSINYQLYSDSIMYYIPSETAQFNPDEAAWYELFLDWSNVEGYQDKPDNETKALLHYYTLKTIDVNQIFAPDNEPVLFPYGTSIRLRKYSLSPEHEAFIRSVLSTALWQGSNFDTEEGNIETNLSNGALGFFAACSVIEYNFTVE